MSRLHILKPDGTNVFREYISSLRIHTLPPLTIDEPLSEPYSRPFEPLIEVEKKELSLRWQNT